MLDRKPFSRLYAVHRVTCQRMTLQVAADFGAKRRAKKGAGAGCRQGAARGVLGSWDVLGTERHS